MFFAAADGGPRSLPLAIGRHGELGPSRTVALLWAIAVGVVVFIVIWKMRKTFGMKE